MTTKLRKTERKNYTDEGFLANDVLDGNRSWSLDEKLSADSFNANHVVVMDSKDVNFEFVQKTGLSHPIVIKENADALGLRVPDANFTISQVKQAVGGRRVLDVVDVPSQKELSMNMKEFCDYYETLPRQQLLNVLSLEFSQTRLENYVESPKLVRQLDWVTTVWPQYLKQSQKEQTNRIEMMMYPKVQKYCLMSVATCWTDFHVDFGGTSVWYHLVRGEKIFFVMPPTRENLAAFEEWTLSGRQDDVFFGDLGSCQRITLQPGWTFFLPCGWIHAVYTPKDSLVFGGNFIHSFQVPMQLRVMELENRIHVPAKFRYPFLQEMYWYVAARYMYVLTGKQFWKPITGEEASQIITNGDTDSSHKDYMLKTTTEEFDSNKAPVLLTEREFIGLRELSNWLFSLPPSKRSLPSQITDPDQLLLELASEIDNHAADDWDEAINGKPLLCGFEVAVPTGPKLSRANTSDREPLTKKSRAGPVVAPNHNSNASQDEHLKLEYAENPRDVCENEIDAQTGADQ